MKHLAKALSMKPDNHAPTPKRGKIDSNAEGKLRDRIAQNVTGQRAGHQFVNQAANRDQEYVEEKGRHVQFGVLRVFLACFRLVPLGGIFDGGGLLRFIGREIHEGVLEGLPTNGSGQDDRNSQNQRSHDDSQRRVLIFLDFFLNRERGEFDDQPNAKPEHHHSHQGKDHRQQQLWDRSC